ncbi:MAG TPA: efflux RND transporter periplasmic adaptor subunit [Candidatus Krumholzibacteria bacterium]|nr:efflux RND transporter periplasmic adaptor subunit [Candidatus Krumholzibacteria bacterium]
MSGRRKLLIAVGGAVVLAVLAGVNLRSRRASVEVQVAEVARRDISRIITASGEIQPRKRVNVSASAIGKVTRLAVKEGDRVQKGDFLLEIDAEPYESAVEQLRAAVRGARAAVDMEKASLVKAEDDFERARQLHEQGFMSDGEFKTATAGLDVARARARNVEESLAQSEASLKKAEHELKNVHITAEMSGVITALNVEAGESAIMGTINNPGTVLLTIADLSEIEAEVRVDETEVVLVRIGQEAVVRLDAHPDTTYRGVVTEVGNSAIRAQVGLGQESVDFKVVVAIHDSIPDVRPGLSASVDITVAHVDDALAIPIQCLTVRDEQRLERERTRGKRGSKPETPPDSSGAGEPEKKRDIEGVLVVENGVAHFREVKVGIAGQSHFVVDHGLGEGEKVVSGPFKTIGDLADGARVKIKKERARR